MLEQLEIQQLQENIHSCRLPARRSYLEEILTGFARLENDASTKKTHYFDGRYENIYPSREAFPEVEPLLEQIFHCAHRVLETEQPLGISFWFNQMQPGHTTTLHTHDDGYELISGVYYLDVPEASGKIQMHLTEKTLTISPQRGMLLLFPPDLPHEVSVNRSRQSRLSMAFNIGPASV
ncbi:MAG: putative 2OG-Fe(II) oxygenase [Pseudomonadota bacterium]